MKPRILVYSRTVGFRHDSIEAGVQALEGLATERHWDLEATEDPATFHDARLALFDIVIFLNTNGTVLDAEGRDALAAFVRRGKGFVGIHGAAATETDWPWYGELVGATFKTHPAIQPAIVRVEDRSHPATRHLPERWQRVDEWYSFHASPRGRARVLMTLDETSYDPGDGAMGSDHPLAWCHDDQGGRAFYTALGHTRDSYTDPLFLEHVAGGIAWALGQTSGASTLPLVTGHGRR
jgi:type 1 glutamine amidotransferase